MRSLTWACAVALVFATAAGAQTWEARVTGEHTVTAADTPEAAQSLATIDATLKLLKLVAGRATEIAVVKELKLTDAQLAAYVAGIVEAPDTVATTREKNLQRASMSVPIDLEAAARLISAARMDGEISRDLIDTWARVESLSSKLAADSRALTEAAPAARARAAEVRQQTLTRLRVSLLLSQVSAALIHQETGTTSIPIVSPEGLLRARKLAEKAMALDETNGDAIARMGDVLLAEDKPEEAEPAFREALRQDPASASNHNKLGNALYLQGQMSDATAQFTEAIRLNPSDAISHSDLGDTLKMQQNVTGAIAEYREAIRLDASYVVARHNLGITLASQQRVPEALAEFQEAVRIHPTSARAHYNAAIALADLEKDEESAKEWREAVRLNPNNFNAHYNAGEMLRLIGELKESAKEFREYVNRAPDTPATQKNKARARTFIEAFEEP
ncbi:MAG TPA: tetratricopeptide repeat protein [Vicinamibacterales bacterium]|nr:tetratricopeptide repeat protein [Vicinamibacterales bacterium]